MNRATGLIRRGRKRIELLVASAGSAPRSSVSKRENRGLVMNLPSLDSLKAAADLVHAVILPTPQIQWPLLSERAGADVWVKHENHTPIGAFKVRGGLVYMEELKRRAPHVTGV